MTSSKSSQSTENKVASKTHPDVCGVVMPIAAMDGYPESHWKDVLAILSEAVTSAGLEANLVSYTEESALIHSTIVQNLYDNPIVVCDVSGKNPNVMFELGLRLAFDKPTIIVKDDKTSYSFDTGGIEHLGYPRDLRFGSIVDFKARLSQKIKATVSRSSTDPNYSTFLKHFKRIKVAVLQEQEVTGQEFLFQELAAIRRDLARLERPSSGERPSRKLGKREYAGMSAIAFLADSISSRAADRAILELRGMNGVESAEVSEQDGHRTIKVTFTDSAGTFVKEYVGEMVELIMAGRYLPPDTRNE